MDNGGCFSERGDRDAAAEGDFGRVAGDPAYPCVGARSVLRRGRATVRGYSSLGTNATARLLLADLARFDQATDLIDGFASFVAVFFGDGCEDEVEFERALWRQLRAIRAVDNADWDPGVSSDVRDPHFSFSAAGAAYFVIGLHPAASRRARWAPHPMLVFNPHEQFEMLRAAGGFERMRDINRRRDKAANGSINPMVADYGDASEACQYSGRLVGPDWCAPFPGSIGVSARHSRG